MCRGFGIQLVEISLITNILKQLFAAAKNFFIISTCYHSTNISIFKKIFVTYKKLSLEYGFAL